MRTTKPTTTTTTTTTFLGCDSIELNLVLSLNGVANLFTQGGGQIFYVGGGGGYDDFDEEINVSEVSKLSAGTKILGVRMVLVFYICKL